MSTIHDGCKRDKDNYRPPPPRPPTTELKNEDVKFDKFRTLPYLLIFIIGFMSGVAIVRDVVDPYVCVENTTVKEILSLNHRDAYILLSNDETVKVNQVTLSIGDNFCNKRIRKSDVGEQ